MQLRPEIATALFESIDVAILTTDAGGRITAANPATQQTFGYREDELLGMDVRRLSALDGPALTDLGAQIRSAVLTRGAWAGALPCRRADGSAHVAHTRISLLGSGPDAPWVYVRDTRAHGSRARAIRRAIQEVSAAAHRSSDLPMFFATLATVARRVFPDCGFYVALEDPPGTLTFPCFWDPCDPPPAPKPVGRGITEYVLRLDAARDGSSRLVTPHVFHQLVADGEVELVGADSTVWMGVQITIENGVRGVCAVQDYDPSSTIGADELQLLEFFADQVAVAVARDQANELARRLLLLHDETTDLIGTAAADGRVLSMNRALRELRGIAPDDVVPRDVADGTPPWAQRLYADVALPAAAEHGRWEGESAVIAHDGTEIPVWQLILAHRPPGGGPVAFYSTVMRDLRSRKAMVESQRLRDLVTLAGSVAHVLNGALTGIGGYTTFAQERLADRGIVLDDLEQVQGCCRQATVFVRQLLAYAGRSIATPKTLQLSDAVRAFLPVLAEARPFGAARLQLELADELPIVRFDPSLLDQLLLQLVSNAIDAIGNRPGTITIATRADGDAALLEVRDDGTGMDRDTLERVFQPFFTTKFLGRGLGLAAARTTVERFGGSIHATSSPEVGSTFTVRLPPAPEPTP